jgi:hypothetical protein
MIRLGHWVARAGRTTSMAALAVCAAVLPSVGTGTVTAHAAGAPAVSHSSRNDVSPPLRSLRNTGQAPGWAASHAPLRPSLPRSGAVSARSASTATAIPTTSTNFDGVGNGFTGPSGTFTVNAAPPDTNAAVGPNNVVQIVNTDYAVFNKSGTATFGPVAVNTLWAGFGGLCQTNNDGDPVVRYDRAADRWIIIQLAVTNANGSSVPFQICVAVSATGDPAGSFSRYSFAYANFPDFPKLAVWPDAYYLTVNQFNAAGTTFLGANVAALNRASMLAGQPATSVSFNAPTNVASLLPTDLDSSTQPPAGSPNLLSSIGANANTLEVFQFHVDFATPANSTFTGPTTLATNAFTQACNGGVCIPQSGTRTKLDSLGDRLDFRAAYRAFSDHQSIVLSHSVTAGSSTGVRWYEVRISSTNVPSLFQQGTYAPDSSFRWMPSIAMDNVGDIAVGFSVSSGSLHPQIHYTGRLVSDAPGTMSQGEGTIIDGAGSQTSRLTRWGDYSAMNVDPTDNCTFWYTSEYLPANGSFNWKTRIASFKFSGCA